jgi:hypothetical protein
MYAVVKVSQPEPHKFSRPMEPEQDPEPHKIDAELDYSKQNVHVINK